MYNLAKNLSQQCLMICIWEGGPNLKFDFIYVYLLKDPQLTRGCLSKGQGGRSCAKARRAFAKKFGLGHMLLPSCHDIEICRDLCTFWKSLGKKRAKNDTFVEKIVNMRFAKILWPLLPSPKGCQLLPPYHSC